MIARRIAQCGQSTYRGCAKWLSNSDWLASADTYQLFVQYSTQLSADLVVRDTVSYTVDIPASVGVSHREQLAQ